MSLIWQLTHQGNDPRFWWNKAIELRYRLLPRPFDRLLNGRTALLGAEVGVFKGEHALSLLKRQSIARLYLVDQYRATSQYDQQMLDRARNIAERKLRHYHQKEWVFLPSVEAAQKLGPLDFCYIDAAHDYESVVADIAAWWPRVKIGGIIGGHDFDPANQPVIQAVIEFAVREKVKLYCLDPDWWIFK